MNQIHFKTPNGDLFFRYNQPNEGPTTVTVVHAEHPHGVAKIRYEAGFFWKSGAIPATETEFEQARAKAMGELDAKSPQQLSIFKP